MICVRINVFRVCLFFLFELFFIQFLLLSFELYTPPYFQKLHIFIFTIRHCFHLILFLKSVLIVWFLFSFYFIWHCFYKTTIHLTLTIQSIKKSVYKFFFNFKSVRHFEYFYINFYFNFFPKLKIFLNMYRFKQIYFKIQSFFRWKFFFYSEFHKIVENFISFRNVFKKYITFKLVE